MTNSSKLVKKFLKLFDGYELAYGQHCNLIESETGKVEGNGDTISMPLEDDTVESHLEGGGNSLGIVPLKLKNTLRFGAIDIDVKNPTNPMYESIEKTQEKINKFQLPLVACQSKSKGIHLYCFTQEEVPAILLIKRLKEWAALLGYGSVEIFPKQTTRADRKDIGNWLNMPYYNYKNTDRWAINDQFKKLDIEEFFKYATISSISKEELKDFKIEQQFDESYNDAPPCLQTLATIGVGEGGRNNGLFDFGVYLYKKFPDTFDEKIGEVNGKIINPPLRNDEVGGVIKSVNRKDFFYKCNEAPIAQYCNKIECKKRKYGIGQMNDSQASLEIENLVKYISDDGTARWYIEVQGKRVQLTTDELTSQALFKKKMVVAINHVWIKVKEKTWDDIIRRLLEKSETYHDPVDASPKGQFAEHLDSFLSDGAPGEVKEDIMKRNCYLDEKTNLMYFRSNKLFKYLQDKRFHCEFNQGWAWLDELGGKAKQISIGKKSVRVWYIAAPDKFLEDNIDKV
ncbi:MAG: hypothetical protein ACJASR_000140 [Psychroserpens sp.]|jgi:hypothetical protein